MRNILLMLAHLCVLSLCAQKGDSISTDSIRAKQTWTSDTRRWSTSFNFGIGYSSYLLKTKEYNELKECRRQHDKGTERRNYGVALRYELSDRFEIVSGLSVFESGFESKESMQLSDTLDLEFVLGCEIGFITDPKYGYVGSGFWDSRYAYVINGLHPKKADLRVKLQYNYLQLPLVLKTNFGKKVTRGFVAIGTGINYMYMVRHTITMTDDLYFFDEYVNTAHQMYYRRWNVSALASVGLEDRIGKNVSFGFSLAGCYQLMSIFDYDWYEDYVENHYLISGNIHFTYHFGKSHT